MFLVLSGGYNTLLLSLETPIGPDFWVKVNIHLILIKNRMLL
ncbi:hypothetical protein XBP1_1550001 [Xenorhabdus bovienii str. puntauvense]|uniref:Uncharacterized protein n=1 Tax=Xenorhabdus bovienii str. puntauvense TaxID=1398201 RepID=A0A077NC11_XENBV|nr:hypothetical protein XBP1_1550001 [Xenorhabdus bovienii str. puntauvense]